jgi:hypothetical protein
MKHHDERPLPARAIRMLSPLGNVILSKRHGSSIAAIIRPWEVDTQGKASQTLNI